MAKTSAKKTIRGSREHVQAPNYAHAKPPTKKSAQGSRKRAEVPSYTEACKTAAQGIKDHGKALGTTTNYEGQVRRGREFLAAFVKEQNEVESQWINGKDSSTHLSTEGEDQMPHDATKHPQFHAAFDGPPIECTPFALALFLAHKCLTEDCGKSTASGIHAGFKRHYEQMKGDKYRGRWQFDEVHKEWKGNPVYSAEVEDMLETCKRKDGEGERRHSRATSIEDMKKFYLHFQTSCPPVDFSRAYTDQLQAIAERAGHLLFNAMSASGFVVWMRVGEETNLKYKNFDFNEPFPGARFSGVRPPSFTLNLRDRKNWQKREKNGEHQLGGHKYNIYPQPTMPEIDMYTHLLDWLEFYEKVLLGRPLRPDDYIFPTIGANGTSVQPNRPMSADIAQKRIIHMAKQAGVSGAEYFTTHCFRRGGAQWRFMFAPLGQKWILDRIRWWGGWALGEHRDTLMRYLLDELYTYEQDHSDALNPNNTQDASRFQPGDHPTRIFVEELKVELKQEITTQIKEGVGECRELVKQALDVTPLDSGVGCANSQASSPVTSTMMLFNPDLQTRQHHQTPVLDTAPQGDVGSCSIWSATSSFTPNTIPSASHSMSRTDATGGILTNSGTINRVPLVPGLTNRLASKAWEQVVKDWEEADPDRSLYVALKDWEPEWRKASNLTQKYGQRKIVALEFIDFYGRDKARFTAAYPEHTKGFTPLLNAIRRRQQERGDCEIRLTRRKNI